VRARRKKWALPFLLEHPELVKETLPLDSPFYEKGPLYLEIGAGKGDFVVQMAARGGRWLALEREVSVSGVLAKKILAAELGNVIVMTQDFDEVYPSLKKGAFEGVYLNFSDPWPKRKHAKRRLTTTERLLKMAALLTASGRLYFKTDNDVLYAFTLDNARRAGLAVLDEEPDYRLDGSEDAESEYERAFRDEGKPIHRAVFARAKAQAK
jgi:tRNA (guanine-N7-)-methyltransferase